MIDFKFDVALCAGDRRLVGEAKLWYVPLSASDHSKSAPVLPLDQSADPAQFAEGLLSYNERKRQREIIALTYVDRKDTPEDICAPGMLHLQF